jgi:hypothetical protein
VKLIVVLSTLLGLIFGLIAIFALETVSSARHRPENEPFFAAWRQFKADVLGYLPHWGSAQAKS